MIFVVVVEGLLTKGSSLQIAFHVKANEIVMYAVSLQEKLVAGAKKASHSLLFKKNLTM